MSADKKYTLSLFLMTKASVDRLLRALMDKEFGIEPALLSKKISVPGKSSCLFAVNLSHHKFSTITEYHDCINNILLALQVPYYGGKVNELSGGQYFMGYLPELERTEVIGAGPYRTPGL